MAALFSTKCRNKMGRLIYKKIQEKISDLSCHGKIASAISIGAGREAQSLAENASLSNFRHYSEALPAAENHRSTSTDRQGTPQSHPADAARHAAERVFS
jgi:hypothetical protein